MENNVSDKNLEKELYFQECLNYLQNVKMEFNTESVVGRNLGRRSPGIRNFVRFLKRSEFKTAMVGARFSTNSGDITSQVHILPSQVSDHEIDNIVKSIIDRLITEAALILVNEKYPS